MVRQCPRVGEPHQTRRHPDRGAKHQRRPYGTGGSRRFRRAGGDSDTSGGAGRGGAEGAVQRAGAVRRQSFRSGQDPGDQPPDHLQPAETAQRQSTVMINAARSSRRIFMNPYRPATSRFRHLAAAVSLIALGSGFAAGFTPAYADTQQSQTYYNQAVQQLQSGNASAAVIQLRNAVQQDPANMKARQLLGELYLATGEAVSAEKELRRVFDAQRSDEVELRLAQALMMQRRYSDVFAVLSP